ncbi:MAG: thioredoxin domain-containing protein [Candidatus Obscuribacterales bacterium]|nr:thioredoxin domain-containing protein [Candidatus Obscuribacterales bacterium]
MRLKAVSGLIFVALILLAFLLLKRTASDTVDPQTIAVNGNHLIGQSSAYLTSHAHNPVNWYPWGEEALARARRENKPIFLSVGYAACHWCHVMERESFQDPETAKILNSKFVPILVDREERPDLDNLYMQAVIHLKGSGGWPLNVFLTPDLKPFAGDSYMPKVSRFEQKPFKTVLNQISQKWHDDPIALKRKGAMVLKELRERKEKAIQVLAAANPQNSSSESSKAPNNDAGQVQLEHEHEDMDGSLDHRVRVLGKKMINDSLANLDKFFDKEFGGFGGGRKFPNTGIMNLFMRAYQKDLYQVPNGKERAFHIFKFTMEQIANGGMHDHVGGGFHRFAEDWRWQVPHFEKMLVDNAMLASCFMNASLLTNHDYFQATARNAADFMLNDLRSPEGGFYTSFDADTTDGEGMFYAFDKADLLKVMSPGDAEWIIKVLNIGPLPNFHMKSVPRLLYVPEKLATDMKMTLPEFQTKYQVLTKKMLELRSQRAKPSRDELIECHGNAMAISGLARVYAGTGDTRYLDAAKQTANFILTKMSKDGKLRHAFFKGKLSEEGFLDDYAYATQAFLDLAEVDPDPKWLTNAKRLLDNMMQTYWDVRKKEFAYATSKEMPQKTEDNFDGSIPSSASIAILDLLRMELLTGEASYGIKARESLLFLAPEMQTVLYSACSLLCDYDLAMSPPLEIIFVSNNAPNPQKNAMRETVFSIFLPQKVMATLDQANLDQYPSFIVQGRKSPEGKISAFVCSGASCMAPILDPAALSAALKKDNQAQQVTYAK